MGIKEIAKLANVSIGTVDRVLHNRHGVSPRTKQKVQKIIKETGYRPNTTASRLKLASVKKIRIAVLFPKPSHEWSYWQLPGEGVERAVTELREMGVEGCFHEFSDSVSFQTEADDIMGQEYHAIVTVPFFANECIRLLRRADKASIPVVFLDTEIPMGASAHFIRQDSYQAGKVGARLLHGLVGDNGLYGIVNMTHDKGIHTNNLQREAGFRKFFEERKKEVRIETLNLSIKSPETFDRRMVAEWTTHKGPKGIFVCNSRSYAFVDLLKGKEVSDIHIVGFDLNQENLKCLESGEIDFLINQQPGYQGYSAIKGLFNFLTRGDRGGLNMAIPVEIIVKENAEFKMFSGNRKEE